MTDLSSVTGGAPAHLGWSNSSSGRASARQHTCRSALYPERVQRIAIARYVERAEIRSDGARYAEAARGIQAVEVPSRLRMEANIRIG